MRVDEIITFDEYWSDSRFKVKRPLRNGSSVMMVGDNVYHHDDGTREWVQEDSHHSNADGTTNQTNLATDTRTDHVLISRHFYYFGSAAPEVALCSIGYKNIRNFKKMPLGDAAVRGFVDQIESEHAEQVNQVVADPFDFARAALRVDQATGKLS